MDIREKLKAKRRKKKSLVALTSIALVTTTLVTLKLTGLSMPFSTKIDSTVESSQIKSATITRLPNTETVTYIYDAADLVAFRDAVNAGDDYTGKTVYLMDDIDLSSVCSETIGSWEPIGTYVDTEGNKIYFAGTFDGLYHRIVNLYYNGNTYQNVGLFSVLANTGVIQNVLFDNVYLYNTFAMYKENSSTGSACGNSTGSIRNCGVNSGTITGRNTVATNQSGSYLFANTGGIVGIGSNIIDGCYNKASVISQNTVTNQTYQGGAYAGGIIGSMGKGTISNCYNKGAINSTGRYGYRAGIAGAASSTVSTSAIAIKNCYNIGTLSGSGTAENYTAAISARIGDWNGKTYTSFTNCYRISSTSYIYIKGKSGVAGTAFNTTYTVTMGNSYAYDVYGINSGYPVLAWQNETTVMSLNKNQAYIGIGEKITLNVVEDDDVTKIIENNYNATNFTWKSTNEDVATVNENGIVTGVSDGYTIIYAKHEESGLYAMCVVNVAKDKANPQIETGNGFTTILKTDGTVWTIGNNENGQLGNGTNKNTKVPVQVYVDEDTKLSNIIKIAVGTDHVLALTKDGKVYGWGSNTDGQLGQNNINSLTYAKPVLSEDGTSYLSNIVDISANGYGSMALDKNGNVYAWGRGTTGEIGNNTTNSSSLPVKTTIKNGIQISIGDGHVGALTSEGVVWSWGQNTLGQLGINCAKNTTYPMKTAINVTELSVGGYHTTVKKIDGTLYACRSI